MRLATGLLKTQLERREREAIQSFIGMTAERRR